MTAPSPTADGDVRQALQAALAAEHAAIYGYAIVGAALSGNERTYADDAWDAHREARDRLRRLLRRMRVDPTPAAPDYKLPHRTPDHAAARELAAGLEERVAATYADVVAAGDPKRRRSAAKGMRDCALRAAHWRGATAAFPGLPGQGKPPP